MVGFLLLSKFFPFHPVTDTKVRDGDKACDYECATNLYFDHLSSFILWSILFFLEEVKRVKQHGHIKKIQRFFIEDGLSPFREDKS